MMGYIFIVRGDEFIDSFVKRLEEVKLTATWVGVSSTPECEEKLKQVLNDYGVPYNLVINPEDYSDYYKLDQFIRNLRGGCTYVHDVGQFFRSGVFETVFAFVQSGGKFAMIADHYEDINDTCFFNIGFKTLKGNTPEEDRWINYYDKVKSREPHMVVDWLSVGELKNVVLHD